MTLPDVQALLVSLDQRADRAAKHKNGRNFARTLRVVVSEVRLELGLREPVVKEDTSG